MNLRRMRIELPDSRERKEKNCGEYGRCNQNLSNL
jgi:hypothetical protein